MVRTYDPKDFSNICGGKIISGYADGTFVTIERIEDAFSLKIGVDGEGTRSKTNNRSGRITFTLMQSSESNDVLSAFALADEVGNTGTFPYIGKDGTGTTVAAAGTAWVKKLANAEFAKEVSTRTWVLETDELDLNVGGNPVG